MFNLVNLYKFDVNGKTAIIQATSLFAAFLILENAGHKNYSYQGIIQ